MLTSIIAGLTLVATAVIVIWMTALVINLLND